MRLPSFAIQGQTAPEQVDLSEEKKQPTQGEGQPQAEKEKVAEHAPSPAAIQPQPALAHKTPEPSQEIKISIDEMIITADRPDRSITVDESGEAPPLEVVVDRKDVPARTVFVDMEPVEGAAMYEVQVKAKTQRWVEPYKFEINNPKLRFRLSPGQYALRTRSREADGTPGKWGKWQDFWIQFRSPTGVYPGHQTEITPKGSGDERVIFEWPAVKRAKAYSFKLFDKSGQLIKNIRTINTWQAVELKLDSTYAWQVLPLASLTEPEPKTKKDELIVFHVGVPEKELRGIAIDVPPVRRAVRYQFEFVRFLADDKTSEPTLYSSREPVFRARLEPGEYEMRVRSEFEDASFSDWSIPHRFWIPASTPKLISPLAGKMIDPDDDLEASVKFKWEPALNAKYYRVRVWNMDGELVATGKTDKTSLVLGVPHEKSYRWHVTALLDRENERNPAQTPKPPTDQTGEFKVDHYIRLNLSAAEEPSQLYAWGRYLTSSMTYQANNYDNNTKLDQQIFGGTGEVAGGYWHRKTRFGLLATAALSGFTTKGLTYTYSHASFLFGYRHIEEGPVRWRVWIGPAFHQTPEVLVDGATSRIYFARIQSVGPEARGIYMKEIKGNWGMQVYASLYVGTQNQGTPNGLKMKEALLYNLGGFATYKYSPEIVGLIGYSYQVEQGKYQSGDAFTNGVNNFQLSGHFLSATIQIGLEKAQR